MVSDHLVPLLLSLRRPRSVARKIAQGGKA
jgi:hypothetical protein